MHEQIVFLRGERLYLRPVEASDMERGQRWINDPGTRCFLSRNWPVDAESQHAWHASRDRAKLRTDITFALVLTKDDTHIGNIGLHAIDWVNRSATTGLLIGEEEHRGKGYGYEAKELLLDYAFNTLNLHRINSTVLSHNPRSVACLKKSGYKEEGRRRQAYFRNGEWIDEIVLGLLASEWRALKQGG